MSLERALEENTAALREFTVYMKLAIEAASVENAKQQTRAWDAKAKLDSQEINKRSEESRAAMHAELAEARDRVAGPLITKPQQKTIIAQVEQGNNYPNQPFPVIETPLPVIETPLPVIETPLPVIETPLPVIEAPVVKAKKPVAEALLKVTAVVLPVTETEVPHTLASVGLAMVTAAKLDRARVVRILAEFGAVRVGDLSPTDWDAFVGALK